MRVEIPLSEDSTRVLTLAKGKFPNSLHTLYDAMEKR